MLLELMELRYGTASTVFCTQLKKKDWHPRLGGGVHADAIMDRIVHNAVWVDMGETNMRQRRGWADSNKKAPGAVSAPVPRRDIGGAVSRYSAVLKRANTLIRVKYSLALN